MTAYRLYKVEDDHVVGPPNVVDCLDDKAAIHEAKKLANGADVEVWDLARRVTRIEGSHAKSKQK